MAKKGRSPSYPGIDLERALEFARTLYRHEREHAAPVSAILSHWNYKPKSGTGNVALAALKKYGLLDDEGSGDERTAKLTQLALDIIIDDRPSSPDRDRLIQRAALEPRFFEEAWDHWDGHLPSDANMAFWLRKRHFTENGAVEFIRVFRSTVEFANLGPNDKIEDIDGAEDGPAAEEGTPAAPKQVQRPGNRPPGVAGRQLRTANMTGTEETLRDHTIPLPGERVAILSAPVGLTKKDHRQLLKYLELMEDSLVSEGQDAEEDCAGD